MVEAGLAAVKNHPLTVFAAETYLSDLRGKVNALILGCTHYPMLQEAITHVLGKITFINPATATAQAAKDLLPSLTSTPGVPAKISYYTSGDPKSFAKIAEYILQEKCSAKKINLKSNI
jgi:glutamate racemase